MKKSTPPPSGRRPTATIDLKAAEITKEEQTTRDKTGTASGRVDGDDMVQIVTADDAAPTAATGSPAKATPDAPQPAGRATAQAASGNHDNGAGGISRNVPPAAAKGSGMFGNLLSAVAGAVIGILGTSFASNQNLLPAGFDLSGGTYREQIIALEDKISALDARYAAKGGDSLDGRLSQLQQRFDAAEARLGAVAEGPSLADKVTALETTIGNLEEAAKTGEGGKLAGLTAVTKELTRANDQAGRLNAEFIKMRDEQSAFREDLAGLRSGQADFHIVTARLADEIAKLQTSAAKLAADMSRPPDVTAQINPLLDAVKTMRTDVNGLMDRESGSRAEGRNIALALSLGELKRAVDQGLPYRAELERVAPHAPRNLDLGPLLAASDTGLVTLEALREQFGTLANTALAAETTAASGSLVDQLVANAKSLVQVRPTGLVEGEGTSAVIARIEYRLERRDLAGALKEGAGLKGDAQRIMQPWLGKVTARHDADSLLVTLEDRIRNSLAGVPAQ